eukprot:g17164.t1
MVALSDALGSTPGTKGANAWTSGNSPTSPDSLHDDDDEDFPNRYPVSDDEDEDLDFDPVQRYFDFVHRCGIVDAQLSFRLMPGCSSSSEEFLATQYKTFAGGCEMEKCVWLQEPAERTSTTTASRISDLENEIFFAQKTSKRNRLSTSHNALTALDRAQQVLETLVKALNDRFMLESDSTHACLRGVHVPMPRNSDSESFDFDALLAAVQLLKNYQLVHEMRVESVYDLGVCLRLAEQSSTECVVQFGEGFVAEEAWREGLEGAGHGNGNGNGSESELHSLARLRHVHCKLSGIWKGGGEDDRDTAGDFTKLCLRLFGPDRCMFASTWTAEVDGLSAQGSGKEDGVADTDPSPPSSTARPKPGTQHKIGDQIKMVIRMVVESYMEEKGLRDRPSSRESGWTMGFPHNWSTEDEKLDLRTRITLEKIFRKSAERKYIM